MFLKGLLVAVVATLSAGWVWHPITWPAQYPIFSGFLVALILGDPLRGIAAAAYINLSYLGWISAGGSMPGNIMVAGVYGTALAILTKSDPQLAPSLAIPLGLLGVAIWQLQMTVNAIWVHRADKYAEEGNTRGIYLMSYVFPQLTVFLVNGLPVLLLIWLGGDLFQNLTSMIPETLVNALTVVGGLMPALGIGMLLNYLGKPKIFPLFFVGFFATLYLKINLMAVAIFGALIALLGYLAQPGSITLGEMRKAESTVPLVKKLSKRDLVVHWLLGLGQESCYNYERLQAVGSCAAMIPIIKKLYTAKEDISAALKRYMVFFNTEPAFIGTMIPGIAASMEEQKANGAEVTDEDINSLRTGLMGPLAGIGDTVSQGIIYPTAAALACSMAIDGNILGPVLFFAIFTGSMLFIGYNMYMLGYNQGKSAVIALLKGNMLNRVTDAFATMGLMVVGAMAAERVAVTMPLQFTIGSTVIVMQDVLNNLVPGLVPLTIVLVTYQMLKRKKSPISIIVGMFVVGILGTYLGVLGTV